MQVSSTGYIFNACFLSRSDTQLKRTPGTACCVSDLNAMSLCPAVAPAQSSLCSVGITIGLTSAYGECLHQLRNPLTSQQHTRQLRRRGAVSAFECQWQPDHILSNAQSVSAISVSKCGLPQDPADGISEQFAAASSTGLVLGNVVAGIRGCKLQLEQQRRSLCLQRPSCTFAPSMSNQVHRLKRNSLQQQSLWSTTMSAYICLSSAPGSNAQSMLPPTPAT